MVRLSVADMRAIALSGRDATLGERLRHCSDRGEVEGFVAAVKARGEWTTDIAELARDMWRVLK